MDFALSNLVNGEVHRICVLTQYKSHSRSQDSPADGATVGVDKEHDKARGFVVSSGGITVVGKGQQVTP